MNQKEQEWTERYIYQVVRRLPRQQRKEVEEQLRELIGDMAEAEGGVQKALKNWEIRQSSQKNIRTGSAS